MFGRADCRAGQPAEALPPSGGGSDGLAATPGKPLPIFENQFDRGLAGGNPLEHCRRGRSASGSPTTTSTRLYEGYRRAFENGCELQNQPRLAAEDELPRLHPHTEVFAKRR